LAVDWFLETYRPPVSETTLEAAETAFLAAQTPHVRAMTLRDYKLTLRDFRAAVRARHVHDVKTADVLAFLTSRNVGKKRWNNLRGDLHAFFEFAKSAPRKWTQENPVAGVAKFKIARDVPEIESATRIRELFAFLETYVGEYGKRQPAGFLVPYFALAVFAGLRPSVVEGEIFKLGGLEDPARAIDLDLNVIRIGPDVAKTNDVRRVSVQPNLRAWLLNYPLADYPIRVPNLKQHVTRVRERCGLKGRDDTLRHTFVSMFVAKFRSIGEAALQSGNSERMIKKHYLNLVSEADAEAFWNIMPAADHGRRPVTLAACAAERKNCTSLRHSFYTSTFRP
jgi:hypothetical protein